MDCPPNFLNSLTPELIEEARNLRLNRRNMFLPFDVEHSDMGTEERALTEHDDMGEEEQENLPDRDRQSTLKPRDKQFF